MFRLSRWKQRYQAVRHENALLRSRMDELQHEKNSRIGELKDYSIRLELELERLKAANDKLLDEINHLKAAHLLERASKSRKMKMDKPS